MSHRNPEPEAAPLPDASDARRKLKGNGDLSAYIHTAAREASALADLPLFAPSPFGRPSTLMSARQYAERARICADRI